MRIALFGFPLTGKSTLFRLLTGAEAPVHAGRGEVQVGVAKVPDPRLDRLSTLYHPRKVVHATVEYLDLAGMEKGEAVKVLPLEQIRTADALAHVVRAFRDPALPHAEGSVDPARDIDLMETEFLLADHTIAERRIEKLKLLVRKANREEDRKELDLLHKCLDCLEREVPLRELELTEDEDRRLRGFTFLSRKPLLVVVNADEEDVSLLAQEPEKIPVSFGLELPADKPLVRVSALSARIEMEIAQLDPPDAAAFRKELGIREPALDRVIRVSYDLLGRISFFTVGEDECRAWTIRRGTPARRAAGAVHSDMERGFIRAEVIAQDRLLEAGSWSACRDRGSLRIEGKDYIVRDGDVLSFRFNV